MKKCIELKYHKNSKQEIVFENLNEIRENDNVVLMLKDGDLTPLLWLSCELDNNRSLNMDTLFIPYIQNFDIYERIQYLFKQQFCANPKIITLDYFNNVYTSYEYCILPKWNIPKDSAVLFLSEENRINFTCGDNKIFEFDNTRDLDTFLKIGNLLIEKYTKLSLIIPELHVEDKSCKYHIENINKVCKELKEKYGVEKIELFVSHCFIKRKYKYTRCAYSSYELDYKFDNWNKYDFDLKKDFNNKPIETNSFIPIVRETIVNDNTIEFKVEKEYKLTKSIECDKRCKCSKLELSAVGLMTMDDFNPLHDNGEEFNYGDYIDKITTTNSTGILEVQKSDKLEVIDIVEFFKN